MVANLDEIISLIIPFGICRWKKDSKNWKSKTKLNVKCKWCAYVANAIISLYLKLEIWEWKSCARSPNRDAVKAICIYILFVSCLKWTERFRFSLEVGTRESRFDGERTKMNGRKKNPIGIYGAIKIKVNKNNIGIDHINWFSGVRIPLNSLTKLNLFMRSAFHAPVRDRRKRNDTAEMEATGTLGAWLGTSETASKKENVIYRTN